MRLSKNLTVGLFGRSAVGKTAIAKIVASRSGVFVRHCGEVAKQRAKELGCGIADLAPTEHDIIDAATRAAAAASRESWMMVEGRYLDLVLSDVPDVLLVELTCQDGVRAIRRGTDAKGIALEDEADALFRTRLSSTRSSRTPRFTVDTTALDENAGADAVMRSLRESGDFF